MNCNEIYSKFGFECHDLENGHVALCTPISLPDQTPVYIFAKEIGNEITITDSGDILMHLLGSGFFEKNQLVSSISNRIEKEGGKLMNGEITFWAKTNQANQIFASFIKSILSIIDYEREQYSIEEEDLLLIEDIVEQISRRNPDSKIIQNVLVKGASGTKHSFPIQADDTVITTIKPHWQSTGAVLRKTADIENAGHNPPLIIMDDRDSLEDAEREALIISSIARTMLYNQLENGSSPLELKIAA